MSDDIEQALLKAFRQMTPTARCTLVDFADFLSQRHPVVTTPVSRATSTGAKTSGRECDRGDTTIGENLSDARQ